MSEDEQKELTKFIVHVLRHEPEKLSLSLTDKGEASWDDVIDGLRKYHDEDYSVEELQFILEEHNKGRLEIAEDVLRAYEGHSTGKVTYDYKEPPQKLFYAVSQGRLDQVLVNGIRETDGSYIKLHENKDEALEDRPRLKNPTVLSINSKEGWFDGTIFYHHNDDWFTKDIPGKHVEED